MVAPKIGTTGALTQNARQSKAAQAKPSKRTTLSKPDIGKPSKKVENDGKTEKNSKQKRKKELRECETTDEPTGEDDDGNIAEFKDETKVVHRCHDVDWDDRFLTSSAGDNKRPRYYEEYSSGYACFYNCAIKETGLDVSTVNRCLIDYVNDVFRTIEPIKLSHLPKSASTCRATAPAANMCINPLQAMRAWALLANVAVNKTLDDLTDFIEKYTSAALDTMDDLNMELLNLHVTAEEDFDGAVRLFAELPHHMYHNVDVRRGCDMLYGGKSIRAAVQHHAFSTDSDGFYSCHRINQEMKLSTNGGCQYVVPEYSAPNWRASMALASAMDCAFHWKTTRTAVTNKMKFKCPVYGTSICSGIIAQAEFGISSKGAMFKLIGVIEGVTLYIIKEDEKEIASPKKALDRRMWNDVLNAKFVMESKQLTIPNCTTSTPISLYKHAKLHGLKRLFSSEKSELNMLHRTPDGYLEGPENFITLFDHYHKANFEIIPARPMAADRQAFDLLEADRAHQCVEKNSLFGEYQLGDGYDQTKMMFTYFEHYMEPNEQAMLEQEPFEPEVDPTPTAEGEEKVIDTPFYYIMTRTMMNEEKNQIIVCAGYFNNTMWVNDLPKKEEEKKKKKRFWLF